MPASRKRPLAPSSGVRPREAVETIRAIRDGAVDGVVVATPGGEEVFTLHGSLHPYQVMVEEMKEGAATLVNGGTIAYSNPRFAEMLDASEGTLAGHAAESFVAPHCLEAFRAFLKECAAEGGKTEICLVGLRGRRISCYLTLSPMRGAGPGVLCLLAMDISPLKEAEEKIKASLREKELLLREVYHRVKNNLQVISSLFRLQGDSADEAVSQVFRASQSRVHAMALVHQKLCQSEDLSRISLGDYLKQLVRDLFQTHSVEPGRIEWSVDACDAAFGIDTAVPLGLIANELVSNAIKHAFPGERKGTVRVELKPAGDGFYALRVSDDGVGLPVQAAPTSDSSFGLWIVNTLASQVLGSIQAGAGEKGGCFYSLTFPGPCQGAGERA
jgi:two-component system, sensor histidine kinase PdtaS